MIDAAFYPIVLAGLGLPVTVGTLALLARHLVYRHGDQEAKSIRAGLDGRRVPSALAAPKEATHR